MLEPKTKKAIDKCRQILVGKIPSPEGQIEHITMAMLYKFMDDMDYESMSLGGKPKFFCDEYAKYSWRKIMSKTVGAQDRYNLYTEALEKFYVHPTMDSMFREMFKNASLPFKEADFLTNFLNEIDAGFDYSDSETLGDAYEYLLSDQSSQKSLGQFRTPRHIIDFVVNIVDPQKQDIILDPACGTAGFLISAYKHIIESNTDVKKGDKLNYDEKKQLLNHLTGYDTEPRMVKIARMNMFLHGALNPDIHEYDTLGMDERWEEKFSVILANPPFMTPQGGIKPHRKFSVKSSRAEVLFVDYILSHIRSIGKAGVVIPDSILYTESNSSYDILRQEMVEAGLYAIVSLPVGVFKPYAKDIKTSIIFIDKNKKNDDKILYVEVNHDGFTLTDTRKPTSKNDLPEAKKIVQKYKETGEIIDSKLNPTFLDKDLIKDNKFILLPNRYEKKSKDSSLYENVPIGKLIEECSEKVKDQKGIEPWSVSNKLGFVLSSEYHSEKMASDSLVNYKIIKPRYFAFNPSRINVGSIAYNGTDNIGCVSPMYKVFKIIDERLLDEYFFLFIKSDYMLKIIDNTAYGAVRKQLKMPDLKKLTIPLPSIDEQKEIIKKIKAENNKIDELNEKIEECKNNITDIILGIWD